MNESLSKNPDVIGFFDEFSPQSTANTQRLWSLTKPVISKNSTKLKANTFGSYAIQGQSTIDFKDHSKKEDVIEFLKLIRAVNPYGKIMIILDNFRSHHAKLTTETAGKLNIDLVFLPPYSPDLNPIEFIWKTIKRELSPIFIETQQQIQNLIEKQFKHYSKSITYAKKWIKKFLTKVKKD